MGRSQRDEQFGAPDEEDLLSLIANLDPSARPRLRPGLAEAITLATRLRGAGVSTKQITARLRGLVSRLEQAEDERLIGHLLLQQRYELFSMGDPDVERVVEIDRLIEWILTGDPHETQTSPQARMVPH